MSDIMKIVGQYEKLRADRAIQAQKFLSGERPYMIFHTPPGNIWRNIRTPEESYLGNMTVIENSLDVPSDHLPVLEPWFGTGVYANFYGCDYVWREQEAPAVHYKYRTVDEIAGLEKPDWRKSEIAQLILEAIRYFKNRTGDAIPIILTDTQSAHDTASLILDASETYIGCIEEPETMMKFMKDINRLIVEFSYAQMEAIGNAYLKPGHIMLCADGFSGISVSDDNLAVGSPDTGTRFNLPLDEELGREFGGIAIHSCGRWAHMMKYLKEYCPSCMCVDCQIDLTADPNPNRPEDVRDALAGTGIYAHIKLTGETEKMLEEIKRVLHPDLKLVVHPNYIDKATAERNYYELESLLSGFYGGKK